MSIQLIDKVKCGNDYWVKRPNHNLLSVLEFKKSWYKIKFHYRKAHIFDVDDKMNGNGDQTRGIFSYLDLSDETCLFAQYEVIHLWHKRLCHVNFDNFVNIRKMKKSKSFAKNKGT